MNINNLKCCGNCSFYSTGYNGEYCSNKKNFNIAGVCVTSNYKYCENWQFDGLTIKERKEKAVRE